MNFWSFLLAVLREPKTSREAMRFTIAGGVFTVALAGLGALAFILRPAETQAIIGTIVGVVGPRG
ncbi:hypothetical protein [Amycolatopsis sp.]|uniref:hypothetical protein n=1 Tax=Amycolatopsis sp. TaxID=37632 RepID=UPI002D7F4D99|nr:hypothetical protein [Amycolatopsis sp.]HET6706446.1 hypothetical protein [Amycolatopsis sp.]